MKANIIRTKKEAILNINDLIVYIHESEEYDKPYSLTKKDLRSLSTETMSKMVRYDLFTDKRDGKQYLLKKELVELIYNLRYYQKGDENNFIFKMKKAIEEHK